LALNFVTTNEHKFKEVYIIAKEVGVKINWKRMSYTEIQSDDLSEIVKIGAKEACEKIKEPCFVEDAGMFIHALKGFPGPYSKFVFLTIGNKGILKLMNGVEDRTSEFRSAVGFCTPGLEPIAFEASVRGKIAFEERGTHGFGFDPIFEINGKTYAEMTTEEKNALSHRGIAVRKFLTWFKGKYGEGIGEEDETRDTKL